MLDKTVRPASRFRGNSPSWHRSEGAFFEHFRIRRYLSRASLTGLESRHQVLENLLLVFRTRLSVDERQPRGCDILNDFWKRKSHQIRSREHERNTLSYLMALPGISASLFGLRTAAS